MEFFAFNGEAASRYGVAGAVLLHHFAYWVEHNEAHGKNIHEGRAWTYNSSKALAKLFPFWSQSQVKRLVTKLHNDGAIEVGNFNEKGYDRTLWFTLSPEVRELYGSLSSIPKYDTVQSKGRNRAEHGVESSQQYQITTKQTNILLPWESDAFIGAWNTWKQERRDRRYKKYTARGEQATLHDLQKISGNDETVAIAIIHQSIAKGWQGLFALKNGKQKQTGFNGDKLRAHIESLANNHGG
jgi:hypothetical protein